MATRRNRGARPVHAHAAPRDAAVLARLQAMAPEAARALVALLDHPDPHVQRRAARAILDLLGIRPAPPRGPAARPNCLPTLAPPSTPFSRDAGEGTGVRAARGNLRSLPGPASSRTAGAPEHTGSSRPSARAGKPSRGVLVSPVRASGS